MVLLDFDEDSLLSKRTGTDVWEVASEVPIRLRINGVDLFGWDQGWENIEPNTPTLSVDFALHESTRQITSVGLYLSVINVAWWGLVALKLARQADGSTLWLGMYGDKGELLFRMSNTGPDVQVHSTPYRRTAQVSYEILETAWREFAHKVREFLLREFPALKDQHYYTEWKEPGWQDWLAGTEATHLPVNWPLLVTLWNSEDKVKHGRVFDQVDGKENSGLTTI